LYKIKNAPQDEGHTLHNIDIKRKMDKKPNFPLNIAVQPA